MLPDQAALTCELTGPPRPVLWDTLDDALDHYGIGVAVDMDPWRHLDLLAAPAVEALAWDASANHTDGALARAPGGGQP